MNSLQPLGLLALRLALALIFIYHGYPKLVHPDQSLRTFYVQHGLPDYFVSVSGILECFGALLLFLGLFTRAAALLLAGEMAVAIWKVHSSRGPLVVSEYEFALIVATACIALVTTGAGSVSLDHLLFGEPSGKKRQNVKKIRY
jgi:putative oxidoreductase